MPVQVAPSSSITLENYLYSLRRLSFVKYEFVLRVLIWARLKQQCGWQLSSSLVSELTSSSRTDPNFLLGHTNANNSLSRLSFIQLEFFLRVRASRTTFKCGPDPRRSKTSSFTSFLFSAASRQGKALWSGLRSFKTFHCFLETQNIILYLLSPLRTLTIYINAYITNAEFALTGFYLPFGLGPCEYVENRSERPRPWGLRPFWSKLLFEITSGSSNLSCLFISRYEKSRSWFDLTSIYLKNNEKAKHSYGHSCSTPCPLTAWSSQESP